MITLIVQNLFDHAAPFFTFPLVLVGGLVAAEVGLLPAVPGQRLDVHGECVMSLAEREAVND